MPVVDITVSKNKRMESIQKDDLCVVSGCCCCYSLCYLDMPGCLGCAGEGECLCIGDKFCCKPGASPYWCSAPDTICQIGCGCLACFLKAPTVCCKRQGQCCCCVGNQSFPCDADMPVLISAYFLTCYPKCGCCVKYSDVKK